LVVSAFMPEALGTRWWEDFRNELAANNFTNIYLMGMLNNSILMGMLTSPFLMGAAPFPPRTHPIEKAACGLPPHRHVTQCADRCDRRRDSRRGVQRYAARLGRT
jgi:hypothetical protein